MRGATTLNTVALAIGRCLESRGCDVRRVFGEAGLDPDAFRDPTGRHSAAQMKGLWELAARETGDPCIGLQVAAFVQPAAFHGLGLAILASANLLDAMRRAARYSRVVSDAGSLVIEETERGVREVVRVRPDVPLAPEAIDMMLATALLFGRMLLCDQGSPLEVRIRRKAPPSVARAFTAYFGCPVEFDGEDDSLLVDRERALRPLPMANANLAQSNDRASHEYMATLEGASFAERVRGEIVMRLEEGEPPRALVARALSLGDKTLQRRLANEGTSYRAILDSAREEIARRSLGEGLAPSEIAYNLGFADQSAFTRACKRWFGCSPRAYRAQLA